MPASAIRLSALILVALLVDSRRAPGVDLRPHALSQSSAVLPLLQRPASLRGAGAADPAAEGQAGLESAGKVGEPDIFELHGVGSRRPDEPGVSSEDVDPFAPIHQEAPDIEEVRRKVREALRGIAPEGTSDPTDFESADENHRQHKRVRSSAAEFETRKASSHLKTAVAELLENLGTGNVEQMQQSATFLTAPENLLDVAFSPCACELHPARPLNPELLLRSIPESSLNSRRPAAPPRRWSTPGRLHRFCTSRRASAAPHRSRSPAPPQLSPVGGAARWLSLPQSSLSIEEAACTPEIAPSPMAARDRSPRTGEGARLLRPLVPRRRRLSRARPGPHRCCWRAVRTRARRSSAALPRRASPAARSARAPVETSSRMGCRKPSPSGRSRDQPPSRASNLAPLGRADRTPSEN